MKPHPSAHELRESALSSIAAALEKKTIESYEQENWFTVETIAAAIGKTRNSADKLLRTAVKDGAFETMKVMLASRPTRLFRKL